MKPILYASTETAFTDNGIGVLSDAMSCKVTHELNGQYELELTYPVAGVHYGEVALRSILRVSTSPGGELQPFRVYRIVPGMSGTATIYARHIVYDLGGYVVSPFTAADAPSAMAGIKSHALPDDMPFTLATDKTTTAAMAVTVPTSAWGLLGGQEGSVLDVYGGEYDFDGWSITLRSRLGSDHGVSVRYGKNLTDLTQDANCTSCYTGVVPYWQKNDVTVTAAPVYASGEYGYTRLMPLDLSSSFEDQPTEAELQTAAASYIKNNQIGVPSVSWEVKLALLSQASGYEDVAHLEQIYLGDTVGVYFQQLGVDAKARVNTIVWDCLLDRYDSVSLGSVKANIASTIVEQQKEIADKPSLSLVERISSNLAAAITGAKGGSVRLLDTNGDGEPDELYIADNPDPTKAKKVWRFNYEGWAASEDGYDGTFTMGATIAGGIQAWMITAANLVAGTISSEQKNFLINLDGGTIDTSAQGNTYTTSDYTQADVTRADNIVVDAITPTLADYEKLDTSGDGKITITDVVQVNQIVKGYRTVNFTNYWRLRIDPADGENLLKVCRIVHNNTTGADTEVVVFATGFPNTRVNSLAATNVTADEGSFESLRVDGESVKPFTRSTIGYVVYARGTSTARAGCFVPYGVSGRFQCASDDWYYQFTFDGYGTVSSGAGTGSYDSMKTVYNS